MILSMIKYCDYTDLFEKRRTINSTHSNSVREAMFMFFSKPQNTFQSEKLKSVKNSEVLNILVWVWVIIHFYFRY